MSFDGCEDFFDECNSGTIVLTKNNQYRIKTGRVVDFHFHGKQFPNNTVYFLISDEQHVVTNDSKLGKELIRLGSICPIVLSKPNLEKMVSGEVPAIERTLPTTPPFRITVTTETVFKKMMRARKEKTET